MVKRLQNFVLPLLGLTLSVMAMYLWYSAQNQSNLPITAEQNGNLDGAIWQEPIIPIPLEIELDARKVALGKRLFNDPTLSHDNTVSCSTCHDLSKGGADGLSYPVGIGNQIGQINTLTVFNSGFNFKLFWDGRAATLEDQMDFPLQHAAEMATSWPDVIAKLLKDSTYRKEFLEIYPEHIQPATVKDAIATFERSLIHPMRDLTAICVETNRPSLQMSWPGTSCLKVWVASAAIRA